MHKGRPFSILTSTDRQWAAKHLVRNSQCVRCFHSSRQRHRTAENGEVPKRSQTRQERSAMISNEVSRLQRAPQAASTTETTSPETLESIDQADGHLALSKESEGPQAQKVNKFSEEKLQTTDTSEEGLLENIPSRKSGSQVEESSTFNKGPGVSFKPEKSNLVTLLQSGRGASTIAAKDFAGVIKDRISSTTSSYQPSFRQRQSADLKQRFSQRRLVRLSQKEIEQVNKSKDETSEDPKEGKTKEAQKSMWRHVVNRMVAGEYDANGIFGGAQEAKHPVLGALAKATRLNGSYLPSDADRFVNKVRSLLPATVPQRKKSVQ